MSASANNNVQSCRFFKRNFVGMPQPDPRSVQQAAELALVIIQLEQDLPSVDDLTADKHPPKKWQGNTHGLRATGATWMAMAGYSLTGLLDHFGWSELRTAQHYVRASGASAMRDQEDHGAKVI